MHFSIRFCFLISVVFLKNSTAQDEACFTSWSPCFVGNYQFQDGWKDRRVLKDPKDGLNTTCLNDFTYVNQIDIASCDTTDEIVTLPLGIEELGCAGFRCGTGDCIPELLTCNGDNDCEDASDEYPINTYPNCPLPDPIVICGFQENLNAQNAAVPKTVRYLRGIPGINQFSLGYDLLKGTLRGSPVSMAPFGSCRRVLIAGETDEYYRLPHNVASISQSNDVSYTTGELFETSYDLLTQTRDGLLLNPSLGGLLSGMDGNVGLSQVSGFKSMMTKSINNSEIYTVVTAAIHVNVFEVNLKSALSMRLSTDFVQRLAELPYTYYSNYMYMKFVQDFGTHYISRGLLGGTFQVSYTYSRCWLYDGYDADFGTCDFEDRLLECSKIESAAQFDSTITIPDKCMSKAGLGLTTYAIKKDTIIKGGTASAAANLKLPVLTSENWQSWVTSVVTSPTIVSENFELTRITELIDSSNINITSERRTVIKKFVNDTINIYLSSYDADSLCGQSSQVPRYSSSKLSCDKTNISYFPVSTYYLTGTQSDYQCLTSSNAVPRTTQCSALGRGSSIVLLAITSILCYFGSL